MTRHHLLCGSAMLMTLLASAACKPAEGTGGGGGETTTGSGTGSNTGGMGTGGDATGGTGGTGGSVAVMACPEPNLSSPTLPNSVQIVDATLLQDETWTADKVYLVSEDFSVDDGHTLTIEAGTVVCFGVGARLSVGSVHASSIKIEGTADKHVVFTYGSIFGDDQVDFWGGFSLNGYADSKVSYLDIFYAGKGGGAGGRAFQMPSTAGGKDPNAPFLVDHLTIAEVQSRAMDILFPNGFAPGSVVHLQGYHKPDPSGPPLGPAVVADVMASATLGDPAVTFQVDAANIPAESRFVKVEQLGLLAHSITWRDLGIPYRLTDGLTVFGDDTTPINFTIEAGVTVQMEGTLTIGNPQFQITPDLGNIILNGTAAKPVVFTSKEASPKAGDWGAIVFIEDSYQPMVSKFDHVNLEFGGGNYPDALLASCTDGGDSGSGLIGIWGFHMFDGPIITNTRFSNSAGDGIRTKFAPKSFTGDIINQNYGDPQYGNTFDTATIAGLPFLDPTDTSADKCE